MLDIRKLIVEKDLGDLQNIIQRSFKTVADEFDLTIEKAPTNPAYISSAKLVESIEAGIDFFLGTLDDKQVGCVAIEKDRNKTDNYFIERLAVLPEYRHRKYGRNLLDYALKEIRERGGTSAGIAIINENKQLKDWYFGCGFEEISIKEFDHLPFRVCFMSLTL